MSSAFEMRLRTIERVLAILPESCPCAHAEVIGDCHGCTVSAARAEGQAAVDSMRRALDADERFNR